jgi:hypothetical protein
MVRSYPHIWSGTLIKVVMSLLLYKALMSFKRLQLRGKWTAMELLSFRKVMLEEREILSQRLQINPWPLSVPQCSALTSSATLTTTDANNVDSEGGIVMI